MSSSEEALRQAAPEVIRAAIRRGEWRGVTANLANGFTQANLAILPRADAFDFLLFCQRNPKPCPVLEVTDAGNPEPAITAPGADLRTDLPGYRVYRHGRLTEEAADIRHLWRDDLVAFLLGCSFSFEGALVRAGIELRHHTCGCNVPMFRTSVPCRPAGTFSGPLVVSMRPIPAGLVSRAVAVSGRFPAVHGAPVHVGDPAALGVADLQRPDWGDPVPMYPGEVPVFWACGVTPQAVALASRVELMITHAPGHMFITDLLDEQVAVG